MIFAHRDMPGVIGKVGNVFGRHRVNIAQMSVGRATDKPGGEAIGVLSLDSAPPAEALAEVRPWTSRRKPGSSSCRPKATYPPGWAAERSEWLVVSG